MTSSMQSDALSDDYQDESGVLENIEDRLTEAMDALMSKSTKTRLAAFEFTRRTLADRYMIDYILNRKITILDTLNRCMKRYSKGQELAQTANIIAILCASIGVCEDTDPIFNDLMSQLLNYATDPTITNDIKCRCINSLALCGFIVGQSVEGYVFQIMIALHSIFKASCAKGDGTMPNPSIQVASLHCACLQAWILLLTSMLNSSSSRDSDMAIEIIEEHMDQITELLDSPHLELRAVAGESLAVMCEAIRAHNDEITADDFYELCEKIRTLSTESVKFHGKRDMRQQRSNFREILAAIENDESPDTTVKFGRERLYLDTWSRKRLYDALCDLFGSGLNHHLAENEVVRDLFGLGAAILQMDLPKVNKAENYFMNMVADKTRSKNRRKLRDNKQSVLVGSPR